MTLALQQLAMCKWATSGMPAPVHIFWTGDGLWSMPVTEPLLAAGTGKVAAAIYGHGPGLKILLCGALPASSIRSG